MKWIGISGTHGVGKSTLISDVENRLSTKVSVMREVARGVISRGFPLGKRADTDSYVCLVAEYIKSRTNITKNPSPVVIFDRTILDTLSYAMVNITRGVAVKEHVIELLQAVWNEEKFSFSEYIYIPVEFEQTMTINDDIDESYRNQVSDKILSNLCLSGVSYSELKGSREKRTKSLIEIIHKYV